MRISAQLTSANRKSIKILDKVSTLLTYIARLKNLRGKGQDYFKHSYDIVVGPIADDGVAYLLGRYSEGSFTIEELAKELEYKKLNSQYFFGTERAISLLKRIML